MFKQIKKLVTEYILVNCFLILTYWVSLYYVLYYINIVTNEILFIITFSWLPLLYVYIYISVLEDIGMNTPVYSFIYFQDVLRMMLQFAFLIPFIGPIIGYITIRYYYKLYKQGYKHIYPKPWWQEAVERKQEAKRQKEKLKKTKPDN